MSNLIVNNLQLLRMNIDERDYWDFHINHEKLGAESLNSVNLYDKCLISYIDCHIKDCIGDNKLVSYSGYTYSDAFSEGVTLENIGYTGLDNGLFSFRKDRVTNSEFKTLYQDSKLVLPSNDFRLHLHAVSGGTVQYEYPLSIDENGYIKLNGGFYQGFFRNACNYSVLPSELNTGDNWCLEFCLKKEDFEKESEKTLNDKYPNNKGIFFYIGTRAENKWMYLYNKDENIYSETDDYIEDEEVNPNTHIINDFFDVNFPDTEDCDEDEDNDYLDDELDISYFDYETDNGFSLSGSSQYSIDTDNKFLMYDNTPSGLKANTSLGDEKFTYYGKNKRFKDNLFLLMNHSYSGYTANNIDAYIDSQSSGYTSLVKDIINNALAFRIKDDGSIGYRYIVSDCKSDKGYKVIESYSNPDIIKDNEWCVIHVRIKASENKMKLMFYVNGKLKYITEELDKLNLHKLDEPDSKQEGVPYNISLGGGTQGLCEAILPNYMLSPTRVYPLEENFAGSFIGRMKSFKFYNCLFESLAIKCNANYELNEIKLIS